MGDAVSIEALKKGFLITDENEDQRAASTWPDAVHELEQILGVSGSIPVLETKPEQASLTITDKPSEELEPDFIFQEAEPFVWQNVPVHTAEKTQYRINNERVHITRDKYKSQVFAEIGDLKKLQEMKKNHFNLRPVLSRLEKSKAVLVRGFLNDVSFDFCETIDSPQVKDEKTELIDPEDGYKPILNTNTHTDYDGGKVEGTLEV